jgi:hypothetical protein
MLSVVLVSCTRNTKILTREELQDLSDYDTLIPVGVYFWDEFARYRDHYSLSDEESMLLGEWVGFGYYCFFPNKLFVYSGYNETYRGDPDRAVKRALGTWFIRDNAVYARIFGFDEAISGPDTYRESQVKHEYITVEPYDVKLVNTRDILSTGYSRKFFNEVEFPEPLKKQLTVSRRSKKEEREKLKDGVGMIKRLYVIYTITKNGIGVQKIFNLFILVPRFVEDNVSGLDIVTNPALIEKYFVESLTFPYEDHSYFYEYEVEI